MRSSKKPTKKVTKCSKRVARSMSKKRRTKNNNIKIKIIDIAGIQLELQSGPEIRGIPASEIGNIIRSY